MYKYDQRPVIMLATGYRKYCVEYRRILPCQVEGVIYEPSTVSGVKNLQKGFHSCNVHTRP